MIMNQYKKMFFAYELKKNPKNITQIDKLVFSVYKMTNVRHV